MSFCLDCRGHHSRLSPYSASRSVLNFAEMFQWVEQDLQDTFIQSGKNTHNQLIRIRGNHKVLWVPQFEIDVDCSMCRGGERVEGATKWGRRVSQRIYRKPRSWRNFIAMWAFAFLGVRTPKLLSFGTFDFFLAGLGRNQVNNAFCSSQTAHEPVQISSAKQATGPKSLLSSY